MSGATYYARVGPDGRIPVTCPALAGCEVVIRERKAQRSNSQNAWLWGVALPLIAEHCGYDEHEHEDLHYDLLSERFGKHETPSGLTLPTQTTRTMTTAQFSDYMEWLVRFAAQKFGVAVPLPGDSYEVLDARSA